MGIEWVQGRKRYIENRIGITTKNKMTNLVRIDYTVNGKTECYWVSTGTLDEIDTLKKKIETTIQEDALWSTECPMKGRGCQCSAREKCFHNK